MLSLEERGINLILLLGNHEAMLLSMQKLIGASVDLGRFPESIFRGAVVGFLIRGNETWATLKSYNLEGANEPEFWAFRYDNPVKHYEKVVEKIRLLDWKLPSSHLDLLCRCKTHHFERNCLFVHSGVRPDLVQMADARIAVERQLAEDAPRDLLDTRVVGTNSGFLRVSCAWAYATALSAFACARHSTLA